MGFKLKKETYLQIRRFQKFEIQFLMLVQHILIDIALVGFSFILCFKSRGWQYLAVPLLAIFMFRSFSMMHEGVHGLISKNKFVNDFFSLLSGVGCALPFEPWKVSHLSHHFWSGNYEKDPVMALVTILPKWSTRTIGVINFLWQKWMPILAFMQYGVFWILSIKNALQTKSFKFWLSLTLPVTCWTLLFWFAPFPILYQVLAPAIVLYLMMVDAVNLPHHLQLPMVQGDQKWPVWEQHQVARTCLYPHWLARFVVLNFNYHAEHHMYPDAPWYQLDQLHQSVQMELGSHQQMDPGFDWIRQNRKLHILAVIKPYEEPFVEVIKQAS